MEKEVLQVRVTPDNKRVIFHREGEKVKVCDLETGKELRTLQDSKFSLDPSSMLFIITPDGRHAICMRRKESGKYALSLLDTESDCEICTLPGSIYYLKAAVLTPDGRRAVTGDIYGLIKIWDLQKPQEFLSLSWQHDGARLMAVTPDGRRAVSMSSLDLKVWDLQDKKEVRTLKDKISYTAPALTADGRQVVIVSSSRGMIVKVYDLEAGRLYRTIRVESPMIMDNLAHLSRSLGPDARQ
jgi:WD40 repeat protein